MTAIKLWHDFNDQDGETSGRVVEELCDRFSATTGCRMVVEALDMAELQDRLSSARSPGSMADMALIPSDMVSLYNAAKLSPLDRETQTSLGSALQPDMSIDGKVYGVPILRGNHLVVFTNRDCFPPPIPTTWEHYEDARARLARIGAKPLGTQIREAFWFYPFLAAAGGSLLDSTGSPALGGIECRNALQMMLGAVLDGTLAGYTSVKSMLNDFIAGKLGAIVCGEWLTDHLVHQLGERLTVAPLPLVDGQPMVSLTSTLGVVYPNESLSGPHREHLLDFTRFLLGLAAQELWITMVGRWPVNREAIARNIDSMNPASRTVIELCDRAVPMPINARMFDIWTAVAIGLERLYCGSVDSEMAASTMQVAAEQAVGSRSAAHRRNFGSHRNEGES